MEFEIGQKVDLIIGIGTGLGYTVLINEEHEGLLYKNEVFKPLEEGLKMVGYIKGIREDGKIDVSLQALGYRNTIDMDKEKILDKLDKSQGGLNLTDKSSPESIKFHLQMSKKAFKRALGSLYKEKKVILSSDKIEKA
ncbi:MAG: DNA-binding protein [Flavobacteriaceae bacterium]|nr:DNA-binding protein [Flavobacteriaceae bacterium]